MSDWEDGTESKVTLPPDEVGNIKNIMVVLKIWLDKYNDQYEKSKCILLQGTNTENQKESNIIWYTHVIVIWFIKLLFLKVYFLFCNCLIIMLKYLFF